MIVVVQNEGRPRPRLIPYGAQDALNGRRPPTLDEASEPVFDQWLTHHLGRLYDPIVQEPIPVELLRLLEIRLKQSE